MSVTKTKSKTTAVVKTSKSLIDPKQVLRASKALISKIQSDSSDRAANTAKTSLLADADTDDAPTAIWLVLTTKKHIIDKKRLKPGKIALPHPYIRSEQGENGPRICLITADPQRKYKDLIEEPSFPVETSKSIARVIGLEKLKAKYNSFESKRQLLSEYDVFLADDRIITYLPAALGKVFYKSSAKRPLPVSLEGRRQNFDAQGNKRRKLAEGGEKVTKAEVKPQEVAAEIEKALSSALIHLAPSTTTAVKVGNTSMEAGEVQQNIQAVVDGLVETYVPQKWANVRAIHIKGPNTIALPIWLADELWIDEKEDVREKALPPPGQPQGKRKRALTDDAGVIEVPGPDGKLRKLIKPGKKSKATDDNDDEIAKAGQAKAEKAVRKDTMKQQKEALKMETAMPAKKKKSSTRMKAADLL